MSGPPQRGRPGAVLLATSGFPLAGLGFVTAYHRANLNDGWVHELFWAAVGVGLATAAAVYALATQKRRAAAGCAAALAVLLSLPKFLRAPQYLNFFDEQAHLRGTQQLLDGGSLFAHNPLNAVVADYPALHVVTATVVAATGRPVHATGTVLVAGTAVVVAARVAGCLAVFCVAERLINAPLVGLAAVVVFTANPAFVYFDAQFSYESLAAPLVAVVLLLALRLADQAHRGAVLIAAELLTWLVVITHHGSSYVLAGVLVVLVIGYAGLRRRPPDHLIALALVAVASATGWLLAAARRTLGYIGPYVRSNLSSIPDFLHGRTKPRHLFGGFLPVPKYEQYASFAAVLVLFLLFCWGVLLAWSWRRAKRIDLVARWVLPALGAGYFLSLPLVALRGDQVVKRLWEFTFIGLGPVCALALWMLVRRRSGVWVAAVLLAVVFVGSGVARSGEHIRFPGPFVPTADPRSMTSEMVGAAQWLADAYGPDNRITGDHTIAAAFGGYGRQVPVTYSEDGYPIWKIFTPDELTDQVRTEITRARVGWLGVDLRTPGKFPITGFYFDESEPGAYLDTRLTVAGLTKFDNGPFRRVYDNGHILLYEVLS